MDQFPSSVAFPLLLAFGAAPAGPDDLTEAPAVPCLSLELRRLWKKFCRTSCWVCPLVGLGVVESVGDETGERPGAPPAPGTLRLPAAGRPDERPAPLRDGSPLTLAPSADEVERLSPLSISVNAFSTFGRLKLLLPMGPTIPAVEFSVGFLKAPLGSRSALLEFSS